MKKRIMSLLIAVLLVFTMPMSLANVEGLETPATEQNVVETVISEEKTCVEEIPAKGTLAEGTPAEEPPAEGTPAEELPAEGTPAEEPPAEEAPAEEAPAEETPAAEVPDEEIPAEEIPAEETAAKDEPVEKEPADYLLSVDGSRISAVIPQIEKKVTLRLNAAKDALVHLVIDSETTLSVSIKDEAENVFVSTERNRDIDNKQDISFNVKADVSYFITISAEQSGIEFTVSLFSKAAFANQQKERAAEIEAEKAALENPAEEAPAEEAPAEEAPAEEAPAEEAPAEEAPAEEAPAEEAPAEEAPAEEAPAEEAPAEEAPAEEAPAEEAPAEEAPAEEAPAEEAPAEEAPAEEAPAEEAPAEEAPAEEAPAEEAPAEEAPAEEAPAEEAPAEEAPAEEAPAEEVPAEEQAIDDESSEEEDDSISAAAYPSIPIRKQPSNIKTVEGMNFTLSVEAEGEGLTYQWEYTTKQGDTWYKPSNKNSRNASYTLTMKSDYDGRKYHCVISDGTHTQISDVVTITMQKEASFITAQPYNVSVPDGTSFVLSVSTEGSGLSYQWQYSKNYGKDWYEPSSKKAKNAEYTLIMSSDYDKRMYRCVVTDGTDTEISDAVFLEMIIAEPIQFIVQPRDVYVTDGTPFEFSALVDETDVTYTWEYSKTNGKTWYAPATKAAKVATYRMVMKSDLDGRLYRCRVTDALGNTVYSDVVHLTMVQAPFQITKQPPAESYAENGQPLVLEIETDSDDVTYQWVYSKNDGSSWITASSKRAKAASFTITMGPSYEGRLYRCIVKDSQGIQTASESTRLIIGTPIPVNSDFTFETLTDGTLAITGYTGTDTEIIIPETIGEKNVTKIAPRAFENFTAMTSVFIPDCIVEIGSYAFHNCTGLISVTIPSAVTVLNEGVFAECTNLSAVSLSNSVTVIGKRAFYQCTSLSTLNSY